MLNINYVNFIGKSVLEGLFTRTYQILGEISLSRRAVEGERDATQVLLATQIE
jgi:hypothetical protein